MTDPTYWFVGLLITVVLVMPVVGYRFIRADLYPTLTDRIRMAEKMTKPKAPKAEIRPRVRRIGRYC
jgi:hypothetical protein